MQSITPVDQDRDDTVYILGDSPDNDFLNRIVRLSLSTFKEEMLMEIPNTISTEMVRIGSMFVIFDVF